MNNIIDNKPIKIIYEDGFKVKGDGYDIEVKKELTPLEAQQIIYNIFGSNDIAALDCSDIPNEIIDKFNSIGCTSFQLTPEDIKEILERQEND